MAGKSSRFPNLRPKWMLTHPSGRFMAIEAIRGLNLQDFTKIYFICQQEHEDKYQFLKGFREELEDLDLNEKTEFIFLEDETRDQPETVKLGIEKGNISGPIVIKDSDNQFSVDLRPGNYVCYADLNKSGLIKPANKSYLTSDKSGYIANIVEKSVISPFFCVGGYAFSSAERFVDALNTLPTDSDRYISHIIFQLILDGEKFEGIGVNDYNDWGTVEDWDRFKRSYATLFVDIDGTLVKNSSLHFPPYIGNTDPIEENIGILQRLHKSRKFQIILTTSRPEKYRSVTEEQMEREGIPYDNLIMGLYHSKRIIINDYSKSNPFKSCDSINLRRDSNELEEILKEALGVDYEDI